MNYLSDDVIDVKEKNKSSTFEDVVQFASDIAVDSAFGVLSGVVTTVGDVGSGCMKVLEGNFNDAANIAKKTC